MTSVARQRPHPHARELHVLYRYAVRALRPRGIRGEGEACIARTDHGGDPFIMRADGKGGLLASLLDGEADAAWENLGRTYDYQGRWAEAIGPQIA